MYNVLIMKTTTKNIICDHFHETSSFQMKFIDADWEKVKKMFKTLISILYNCEFDENLSGNEHGMTQIGRYSKYIKKINKLILTPLKKIITKRLQLRRQQVDEHWVRLSVETETVCEKKSGKFNLSKSKRWLKAKAVY